MTKLMKKMHMKQPKQLSLIKPNVRFFGGALLHGRRKSKRILSTKDPIHLVMKSNWAMGPFSFLICKNRREIIHLLSTIAQKYNVKIYRHAVVGNHLHLIIKIPSREMYSGFIRELSGRIAAHIMKAKSFKCFKKYFLIKDSENGIPNKVNVASDGCCNSKHIAGDGGFSKQNRAQATCHEVQGKGQRFWQFRPFSRVLHWGNDFKMCCNYLKQNILEAMGFIPYQNRNGKQYFRSSKTLFYITNSADIFYSQRQQS